MVDRGILNMRRDLAFILDPKIRSQAQMTASKQLVLPEDFRPDNWDVVCHGGRENHEHSKWKSDEFGSEKLG
jgi:hypothetical protein